MVRKNKATTFLGTLPFYFLTPLNKPQAHDQPPDARP